MDKRIIKTKRNIKQTLTAQLETTQFEKISVSELCRLGEVSRITFYTHYDDKYALIDEMFDDFLKEADDDYHMMQLASNPDNLPMEGYRNLLECILHLYERHWDFFRFVTSERNPYLFTCFYHYLYNAIGTYILQHDTHIKSKYHHRHTAALICNGLWAVMNECHTGRSTREEVYDIVRSMYQDLLNSDLFIH